MMRDTITTSISALLTIGCLVFLSTNLSFAGAVDLPKTGQTTCYDTDGTVISCEGTGQDGEILYEAIDLGLGHASTINNSSQVGGYDFIWDKTNGRRETGTGWTYISDNGQVAGSYKPSDADSRPCIWNAVDGIQDIGSVGHRGYGCGINNSGQVAAWYSTLGRSDLGAFLWDSKKGMQDLSGLFPDSCATDINNKGQVAINAFDAGSYFWDSVSGYKTYIGPFRARKVNNIGQVIGEGYIWDNVSGLRSLGTIGGYTQFSARGINDKGVVVGICHAGDWEAFIWDETNGMTLLQDLIDPKSGWILRYANDINVYGEIVGMASLNGEDHAILLTPVLTEPTLTLSTSGTTVTVSWTSVATATGYTLFYAPYPYTGPDSIGSIDMGSQTGGSFGLWDGAAFYVAIQAYNSFGNSGYSNIEYFVINTSVTPPTVTTGSATSVTSSSATLNGTVNPNGSSTTYYFQYGATTSYGTNTTSTSAGSGSSSVTASASVSGVSSGTTYYYRLVATNSGGSSYGAQRTFTTGSSSSTYTNSLGQTFVLLPAGMFTMGSPRNEPRRDYDETQHQVTLTQPFYMQTTEVTQAQWEAVMGSNPSEFSGRPTCPVEWVSWDDVQPYITKMNLRGEGTYSLPTEAQWEYAARAGSTTAFANGPIMEYKYPAIWGCEYDPNLDEMGWYCYNAKDTTHPVGQKKANAWGLYDMHGNVWELCQDWYASYPSGSVTDPTGPSTGLARVVRSGGGKWNGYAWMCRSAKRAKISLGGRGNNVGFRLVRQP